MEWCARLVTLKRLTHGVIVISVKQDLLSNFDRKREKRWSLFGLFGFSFDSGRHVVIIVAA